MRIVVNEVTSDGSVRRGVLDTSERSDSGRCETLVEQAALGAPPPYRPVADGPVYHISANGKTVLVAEKELVGPLRELVMLALESSTAGGTLGAGA